MTGKDGGLRDPPDEAILVGRIGRPHGVTGEIRVVPTSGRPERLEGLTTSWLVRPGRGCQEHEVLSVRLHGDAALMTLAGIADRDEAAAWTNGEIWARRDELPPLEEDEFAVGDVIGVTLYDGDRPVGPVMAVVDGGGRDYFEVEHDGRRVLIPAVKSWLMEWSPGTGRLVMRLPAGILEDLTR